MKQCYSVMIFIGLLLALVSCSPSANSGSNPGSGANGGNALTTEKITRIFQRVFPASRNLTIEDISPCSDNASNYEAFVSYELYDNLFNRYTAFAEWYVFWPPFDENSFFRGRCT